MRIISNLNNERRLFIFFIGFFLIGIIGLIDYWTGYEYALSLFYVLPISLITWSINRKIGYAASVISALVWYLADLYSGHPFSQPQIIYWNTLIRFAFFVIITFLLSSLKSSLEREKELSHTDFLTGASNSRNFYEVMEMEINRHKRYQHPFTLAYIDVDNLKSINDLYGHASGDLVLKDLVNSLKKRIRNTDMIARLGGDEFAIFFPETDKQAAPERIKKLCIDNINQSGKPITVSIGVLSCKVLPGSIDELITMADKLMYTAKTDGKNTVEYSLYEG
jgi:diguanylate cyclase (GGDEF)-like protein